MPHLQEHCHEALVGATIWNAQSKDLLDVPPSYLNSCSWHVDANRLTCIWPSSTKQRQNMKIGTLWPLSLNSNRKFLYKVVRCPAGFCGCFPGSDPQKGSECVLCFSFFYRTEESFKCKNRTHHHITKSASRTKGL